MKIEDAKQEPNLRQYKQCVGCGCDMSATEPQPCAGCRDDDDPREAEVMEVIDQLGSESCRNNKV